jgi:nucleoside-diphosphate-sugar epimerase
MDADTRPEAKPIVLITGAAGAIGSALAAALGSGFRVVGLDLEGIKAPVDCLAIDLTSDDSVELALRKFRKRYGARIASVVHLAAYFDFTGEDHPLYRKVNVEGTRRLLRALQDFEVGQFVYSGTMLVHAPGEPGQCLDEQTLIEPKWAYPESKAAAEAVIREEHGAIPYVLLHLAGLYDDRTGVPTLAQQIARIYERDVKSHFDAGDLRAGQAFVHKDDMIDAFRRVIDRRDRLPSDVTILIGEPDALGYGALQEMIGRLIHGEKKWATATVPKTVAKAGAWIEKVSEPVVPDAIDQGEKPFIRPFNLAGREPEQESGEDHPVDVLGPPGIGLHHLERAEGAGARHVELDLPELGEQPARGAAIAPGGSPVILVPFHVLGLHGLHHRECCW